MIDPLILVRAVHFAATVLAAGTIGFMVLVAKPAARAMTSPRPAEFAAFGERLMLVTFMALALAMLSGAVWLVLVAANIYGVPMVDVCLNGGVVSVITDTRFGQVAIVRLMLALFLASLLPWPATQWVQLAAAVLLIALLAFIGHAGATPGTAGRVHLAFDTLHLLAAGAWLGGLPAFAMLLGHGRGGDPGWPSFATDATKRFSLLGIVSVGTLVVGGLVNTWFLLSGPRDLLATDYGRLVLCKIGLFAAMIAIATVNRYHLTPQLPEPTAMRALRRNSLAEIGLGLLVMLFVGALGTIAPAAHFHHRAAGTAPEATYAHIHGDEAMADVTIDPARPGPVRIDIRLSREDSSDFSASEVVIYLTPREKYGGPPLSRTAKRLASGVWQVDGLEIGQPGVWVLNLIVKPPTGDPIVLDAPVVIDP